MLLKRCGVAIFQCRIILSQRVPGCLAVLNALSVGDSADAIALLVLRLAGNNVFYARNKSIETVSGKKCETMGNGNVEKIRLLVTAHFLGGIQDAKGYNSLSLLALVETFHGGKFHGLLLGNYHGRGVATDAGENDAHKPYPSAHLEAAHAMLAVATLQEHPATHSHHKGTTQCPATGHGVEHLGNSHGREGYLPKTGHLVAHGLRIEGHAGGILHPRVSYQYPQCRDSGTQRGEPCGCEMKCGRNFFPPKKHYCNKGRFHKESQNALNGKWRAKDVAHKPAIV